MKIIILISTLLILLIQLSNAQMQGMYGMEIPGSRLNRGRGNNRGYNMRQGEYNMRGRYDMGPGYGSGTFF